MSAADRPVAAGDSRVAIVTGASRGLGAGLVSAFRGIGYSVLATSRSMDSSDDPQIATVSGDIGDPDTARRVVACALERFGRIDSLINNAGVFIGRPFLDYTLDDFATVTAVNLAGFFHMTQHAIAAMLERGAGHVVNISTSVVEDPESAHPAALASLTKGGLAAVTRSLAIEYASRGIRANAVSLGVIRTSTSDPDSYAESAALHPLGRVGEIGDVTDGILYLERAPFVTGEILHIDGGQSAGH